MTSRKQTKTKYQPEKQWLQMLTAFVMIVALAVGGFTLWRISENGDKTDKASLVAEESKREQRIEAIFDSFKLGDSYKVTSVDIFGDKRIYAWDNGRSYASSIEYMRFEPVDDTAAHAIKAIESAGFELQDNKKNPADESVSHEYQFQNSRHEYVHLTVTSREVNDAIMTGKPTKSADKNAAPAVVLIKVNLDDNNA